VSPSSVLPAGAEFDAREKKPASSKRWAVQIQATTQETAAQNVAKQLREQGLSPVISRVERQGEVWYRVRIGKFTNAEEAESLVSRFRREGKFTQAYPVLE
jgi:cell division protein FtsN